MSVRVEPARRLADEEARRRIAEDLDATLVVEAAAGTGKTTVLVDRILAVVAAGHRGATLGRLVAVTFTEKAAGEMKLRLRAALEQARARASTAASRARFEGAMAELEVARIGTLHAFCAELLREHPVAAHVDPLFRVATEDEARALFDVVFDAWFARTVSQPPPGVRRLLRRRARGRDRQPPRELLRDAGWRLVEHRDFDARWRQDAFDRDAQVEAVLVPLRELASWAAQGDPDDWLQRNLVEVARFIADLDHREAVAPRDHDGLEAGLGALAGLKSWTWRGGKRAYSADLPRDRVVAARDAAHAQLQRTVDAADAHLASLLQSELWELVRDYEERKEREGLLDFTDLLLKALALLRDAPEVRQSLRESLTHLFVDEFQDTDPLQVELLKLLAADVPGKLFVVGDPKQSIYRFRRAEVALYERVKSDLVSRGAALLHLTTSFRAVPGIQSAINAAFGAAMGEGGESQARYVPLSPFRDATAEQPAVVALPVPRPYSKWGKVTNWEVDASYPDAVGAFVDFLLRRSGWRVRGAGGELVSVEAQHVCILFKRFNAFGGDVTLRYAKALEGRRIPHALVGGRSFHTREEVLALRNALSAIEWPDDELAVYATLKGPLFGFADDALWVFRDEAGSLHPLRPLPETPLSPGSQAVFDALALLKGLHRSRNRRPIADTLARLLEGTRAHAGFALWPSGDQALANIAQMLDQARRFEASGGRSFRAFIDRQLQDAEDGEAREAAIVEEGTQGVRLMTVHRAKGLEFPVVILADPTAPAVARHPSRWVDPESKLWAEALGFCVPAELRERADEVRARDAEETVRLAYVAATRARDVLVVPVVGDEPLDGWVAPLNPAVYPAVGTERRAQAAPGCPTFASDSVLDRPDQAPPGPGVQPGLHTPEAGNHSVVWWDPAALQLDVSPPTGLVRHEVLVEDAGGAAATRGASEEAGWSAARAERIATAQTPAHAVVPARQALSGAVEAVEVVATDKARRGRHRGRRFGTVVHEALAAIPFDAKDVQVRAAVQARVRAQGAPAEEEASACEVVAAALRHPLLRAAAASAEVRRESPITLRLPDGTEAEGAVDLAFRDSTGWVVVDFKTADELEQFQGAAQAQVSNYVRAIASSTGLPTRGVVLSL